MPKVKNSLICGTDCTLKQGCKHPCIGLEGNPSTAEILFVGEAPGENEDKMGLSFVGQAGKLLRDTLATHKVTNFCIVNSVRCRPPSNRTPSAKEIQACKPFLLKDIANRPNLKLIFPLGNISLASLL